jgi:hypothetical protein
MELAPAEIIARYESMIGWMCMSNSLAELVVIVCTDGLARFRAGAPKTRAS